MPVPDLDCRDSFDRRNHPRWTTGYCSWLRSARLKYGPDVHVLDISAGGMLVETEVKPERCSVVFELAGDVGKMLVPSRMLRSELIVPGVAPLYRVACVFTRPLALSELTTGSPPDRDRDWAAKDRTLEPLLDPRPAGPGDASPRSPLLAAVDGDIGASGAAPDWQKIVVRYRDGNLLRGYSSDFHPSRLQLHLTAQPLGSDPLLIPLGQLKALFFVRDFSGDAAYSERKSFLGTSRGRRIEVTFHDGEALTGYTLNYRAEGTGFFVHPADVRSNNLRVFVVSTAIRHLRFL